MENILFIRMRLLGDIIFTIPAIQLYKRYFPDHDIYYVAEEKFRGIAELIPGIKKVIIIPYHMKLKDLLRFRKEIKKIGFSAVVDFHSGPKSALLTFLTGIKIRIGYRTPNRNWAFNRLTPRTFGNTFTHSVYNQAMLLEHCGIPVAENPWVIPGYPKIDLNEEDISDRVKQVLPGSKKKITIHIGAGNEFRDWGFDKFSSLIRELRNRGVRVFLIGHTDKEKERGERLSLSYPVVNFSGRLSIKETLYLISRSDVYFGIDSGPLHLASLTETPVVTVYGPNKPEISGPWRKKDVSIIQTALTCRPCSQRKCRYDTIRCMAEVTVHEVVNEIVKYLRL